MTTPEKHDVDGMKEEKEELRKLAVMLRTKMLDAYAIYSKFKSQHENIATKYAKLDRKIFLIDPGITKVKAHKPKKRKQVISKDDFAEALAKISDPVQKAKIEGILARLKKENETKNTPLK